jgi:hypothetical protein
MDANNLHPWPRSHCRAILRWGLVPRTLTNAFPRVQSSRVRPAQRWRIVYASLDAVVELN